MAEKKIEEKDEKPVEEKEEKDEKELLKHDEKVEERDALSRAAWAFILIWAGLVFLAVNTGWMDRFLSARIFSRWMPAGFEVLEPGIWGVIMLGAGIILLIEVIIRLLLPTYRRHFGGTLILAAVFIGVGLGNFYGWDLVWPFVLIALGASVLLGGFFRRKQ
jgi:hypothetical protein